MSPQSNSQSGDVQSNVQQSASNTLKSIARAYPGRLGITLSLVGLENALLLAYPLFAGFAVDAILRSDAAGALFYAAVVLSFWLVGAVRRSVDTRTYTRIYADLAVPVILNQRMQRESISTAAARVVLAREFVDFFERHVPAVLTAMVSIVGAALMLLIIEPWVGLACLLAVGVCTAFMPKFARKNEQLHQRLNNRLEKEIGLVERVGPNTLHRHYRLLSRLRIRLSDREATAYLVVGTTAALLFVVTINQLALSAEIQPGHVYAVMTYLWTFVGSLDEAPAMVDQMARLKDIGKRVQPGTAPSAAAA